MAGKEFICANEEGDDVILSAVLIGYFGTEFISCDFTNKYQQTEPAGYTNLSQVDVIIKFPGESSLAQSSASKNLLIPNFK